MGNLTRGNEMRRISLGALAFLSACNQPTTDTQATAAEVPAKPTWTYGITEDKMRGNGTYWAQLKSSNQPELDFPYEGGSPITLQIVKQKGDPHPDNYAPELILTNGQFDCSGLQYPNRCYVSVKADDQPVELLLGSSDDCGSARCLGLQNDPSGAKVNVSFVETIRAAKRLTIEVPLYRYGSYQYEFDVAGLNWSKETDRQ